MIFKDTPIEEYKVNDHRIYVKREDLCCDDPFPRLCGMRGVYRFLKKQKNKGIKLVGAYSSRVCETAKGVALISKELDLKCNYYFGRKKGQVKSQYMTASMASAQTVGQAILCPLQATRARIIFSRAKSNCKENHGVMVPHGDALYEITETISEVIEGVDYDLLKGTIIIPVALGSYIAGIICGLTQIKVVPKKVVIIVSFGRIRDQLSTMKKFIKEYCRKNNVDENILAEIINSLFFYKDPREYYDGSKIVPPFPSLVYQENKAWEWLIENIDDLSAPILYFNLGS